MTTYSQRTTISADCSSHPTGVNFRATGPRRLAGRFLYPSPDRGRRRHDERSWRERRERRETGETGP